MAKNQTTEARVEFNGVFTLGSFEDDNKEKREFLEVKLLDPFPNDPIELPEVKLAAKWDKRNDKGTVIKADPLFALLKSCALKALRTCPAVPFTAYAKVVTTKTGDEFPNLYIESPFEYMQDDNDVQVDVKGADAKAVFNRVLRKKLGLQDKPVVDDEDDPF